MGGTAQERNIQVGVDPVRIVVMRGGGSNTDVPCDYLGGLGYDVTSSDLKRDCSELGPPPDFLILDIPDTDVRQLPIFSSLRRHPSYSKVFIVQIVLEYPDLPPDVGADAYLVGRLSDTEWRARLREWLRQLHQQSRYQTILQSAARVSNLGWWDHDLLEERLEWSAETYRIFGISPASTDLDMGSFLDRVHPDDRARLLETQRRACSRECPLESVYRVIHPDGKERLVLDRGEIVFDANGKPERKTGVVMDITDKTNAQRALASSEERYRGLVETSHDIIWATDVNFNLTFCNQATQRILGYSPEEMLQIDISRIVTPDQLKRDSLVMTDAAKNSMSCVRYESELIHRDGTRVPIAVSAGVVRDESGKTVGFTGITSDITERKQSETAYREGQARLRLALEAAQMGDWEIDLVTQESRKSPLYFEIFGYEDAPPGWTLETFFSHVHEADQAAVRKAMDEALTTYCDLAFECRIFRKDKSMRWIWARGQVVRDEEGVPRRMLGILADVTQRKNSEAELRLLSKCLERLNDIVLVTKAEPINLPGPRIVFVNDAFSKTLGYSKEEAIGNTPRMLQGPKTDRKALDRIRQALERGHSVREELINYTKSGEEIFVELDIAPVVDELGWYSHLVAVQRDVTERKRTEQKLQISEAVYRELFVSNPMPMWVYDSQTLLFLAVNEAAEQHYGYSREELLTLSVLDLHPAAQRAQFQSRLDRREEPLSHLGTWTQLKKDGTDIEVELTTHDMPFHGRSAGLVLAIDVTERLRAEANLRETDERFQLLSKATTDAIWDWNIQSDTLWWNEGYQKLFGHNPDDALDIPAWRARVHPEDLEAIETGIDQVLASGLDSWSGEYRFQRQNRSYAYVLDRGHVIYDANGKAIRMIGGMTDLSERKRAEERIAEQADLLNMAQDAIIVGDMFGAVLFWNKSAERLYGWTSREARDRRFSDLFPTELAGAGSDWTGELEQTTRTGEKILVQSRCTLVRDPDGYPKSILAINTDITEKKRLEAQYLRAQRMEGIGTLAGGIAHDLNNILAPIVLSIEILKASYTDPEHEDYDLISTIDQSARRGADLVRQVLSFARGVDGSRLPVDMKSLIAEISHLISQTFPRTLQFVIEVADDLPMVLGDPTQIHQVLLNLCLNARDATPNGGTIFLSAENSTLESVHCVLITVRDTGCGIPASVLQQIFDPFFTTKEMGKGTGLGLSTALAIIESHKGTIQVSSVVGEGTTFKVYLPSTKPIARPEARRPAAQLPRGNGEMILLVDDEPAIRLMTGTILRNYGYEVLVASDGLDALKVYGENRQQIRLVLTDMMMPNMDGPTLITQLLARDPALPILAASGLADPGVLAAGQVKAFLSKPYSAETLMNVIHQSLHSQ